MSQFKPDPKEEIIHEINMYVEDLEYKNKRGGSPKSKRKNAMLLQFFKSLKYHLEA